MKNMNPPEKRMNVLWLSNILFPEPCRMLGLPEPVLGGWMYAGAQELMKAAPDLKLAAVMFYPGRTLRRLDGEAMTYYLVPAPADIPSAICCAATRFLPSSGKSRRAENTNGSCSAGCAM